MKDKASKQRAPRNRTITLSDSDIFNFKKRLIKINKPVSFEEIENKIINQDIFEVLDFYPIVSLIWFLLIRPITSIKLSTLLHLRKWSQKSTNNGLTLGFLNLFGH